MVLAPRHRQLALIEAYITRAHTMNAEHFVASSGAANDFNVGLGDTERFCEKLSECFIRGAIDWSRGQCDFERAFSNAKHAITACARCNAHLERDRAFSFSDLQPTHRSDLPT